MAEPPPFRPRVSDGDRSLADVQLQLAAFRRRANAFVLQDAVYVSAAGTLVAVATLLLLAILASRLQFAAAVWLTVIALLAVSARAGFRARTRWIPFREAALRIDRRAALEERLATLAAIERDDRRASSPLFPLLLEQNLGLLPRWAPKTLVPRLVPRTVFVFLATLAVAVLVARWTGLGWHGGAESSPEAGDDGSEEGAETAAAGEGGDERTLSFLTDLPDRIREAILRATERADAAARLAGARGGAGGGDGQRLPGAGGGQPGAGDAKTAAGSNERLRNPSEKRQVPTDDRATGEGKPGGKGEPAAGAAAGAPLVGDGPKTLPRVESGQARTSLQKGDGKKGGGAGRGAGGAGAGSGGDGEGLFGARVDGTSSASSSFLLDLAGQNVERKGEVGEPGQEPSRIDGDLSADQRLDDAIRRAQVPPEYERIVQRIFSRGGTAGKVDADVGTR